MEFILYGVLFVPLHIASQPVSQFLTIGLAVIVIIAAVALVMVDLALVIIYIIFIS
jgi:hypothetical protein